MSEHQGFYHIGGSDIEQNWLQRRSGTSWRLLGSLRLSWSHFRIPAEDARVAQACSECPAVEELRSKAIITRTKVVDLLIIDLSRPSLYYYRILSNRPCLIAVFMKHRENLRTVAFECFSGRTLFEAPLQNHKIFNTLFFFVFLIVFFVTYKTFIPILFYIQIFHIFF